MASRWQGSAGIVKPTVLLVAALAILLLDQVSKALVIANLALGERVHVIGDLVQVWHVQNRGAAFSLLQEGGILFLIVSVLSIGLVAYFHRTFRTRGWGIHLVLGIVLGGTLGNFVDRLREGYVTDWLSIGIGDTRWPTFNVADSSIVIGIGVLVLYMLLTNPERQEARA